MLKVSGTRVSVNRGDTAFLTVNVRDNTGADYTLKTGDTLWFAVKAKVTDDDYAIAPRALNGKVLSISSEDTINLDPGTYVYDVTLIDSRGYVSTIIQPSDFIILPSVTAIGDR